MCNFGSPLGSCGLTDTSAEMPELLMRCKSARIAGGPRWILLSCLIFIKSFALTYRYGYQSKVKTSELENPDSNAIHCFNSAVFLAVVLKF